MKLRRISFLVLLLFSFNLFSVFMPIFAAKVKSYIPNQRVFLEIPQASFCRYPSSTVTVPIIIGNLDPENRTLIVRKIEIYTSDGDLISEKSMFSPISSVSAVFSTPEEVRSALGIKAPLKEKIDKAKKSLLEAENIKAPLTKDEKEERRKLVLNAYYGLQHEYLDTSDNQTKQDIIQRLFYDSISIDLKTIKPNIEPVDFTSLRIKVLLDEYSTVDSEGNLVNTGQNSPIVAESEFNVFLLESLPATQGWQAGDGHLHSIWSDGEPSIAVRASYAASKGYKWIIITDHAGDSAHTDQARLEEREWQYYVQDCIDNSGSITICPGEELATAEGPFLPPPNSGHLLCYANSSYASSYGTCQELINKANSAGGFGIIAHPYNSAFLWGDWNASGFRGLEIISNQSNYSSSAVSKWDTLLTNNLQGIISGSYPKIIGMAGSDSHSVNPENFGRNMTYVFTDKIDAPSQDNVYTALREGKVIASSDGSFAAFTVRKYDTSNYAGPGQIIEVNTGDTLEFVVYYRQVNDVSTNVRIKIISNNGEILNGSNGEVVQGPSGYRTYYGTITKSRYYRVQVEFENPEGYVFVNPAYVKVNTSPNFSLSASPPSQTVSPGVSTSYTVNLTSQNGFN